MRKKTSTTRLPQTLRDEIDEATVNNNHHQSKNASRAKLSRKEARKAERLNRKQHKAAYFSGASHNKRPAEDDLADVPKQKRAKHDTAVPPKSTARKITSVKLTAPALPNPPKASVEKKNRPPKETAPPRIRNLKDEEEDAYISYLEAKLGFSKSGAKKATEDDGLDGLLDFTNSITSSLWQHDKDEASTSSEEMDDDDGMGGMGDVHSSDTDTEGSGSTDEDGEDWQGIEAEDLVSSYDLALDHPGPAGEMTTRYVPPPSRNKESADAKSSETIVKLSRRLKGLLNRMTEQNMMVILDSIEDIYREHRRNDVTSTLTTLIIDGISSHSTLLDSYVVLYAAFVSSLHKIIGIEFAAYFVQNTVSSYERHLASYGKGLTSEPQERQGESEGKECSNLVVLLSELYNFQVVSSLLLFDIIRGLLGSGLSEFCVELLLKVLRTSGQQLRQDDPSALKDIIQIVQTNVSDKTQSLSSRTRFMLETLINLKNNKLKRNVTQNQGAETVERMKKFLAGIAKKRHVVAHEPLRVSLEDLHTSGTKGKWWLVGAAWAGDPLVDRRTTTNTTRSVETVDSSNSNLELLARKQGMNNDIRRSIFVVLMSSDDYVDACERLSQLKLTEIQQREIIRVILHCCGNERSYNPYYTLVCQHLCRLSHSHKITLQFCLWDFFRDLGETSVGGLEIMKMKNLEDSDDMSSVQDISDTKMRNIARAYGWWIAKDCVTITILKPIDFTSLKTATKMFLREMLVQVFVCSQRTTPMITPITIDAPPTRDRRSIEEIFIKATRIQPLSAGLLYFLSEGFRTAAEEKHDVAQLIDWACAVAQDTLRTSID